MSKSVEEMRKASKQISYLTAGLGIFFLGILVLFTINTRRIEPIVVTMFGCFAFLMFLLSFVFPRILVPKMERSDGWLRIDNTNQMLILMLVIIEIFIILSIIARFIIQWIDGSDNDIKSLLIDQVFRIGLLILLVAAQIQLRKVSKVYIGYQSKVFPDLTEKNIGLPAHLFGNHGIPFRSLGEQRPARWTTFNDVLELPNGVLLRIRLPKTVGGLKAPFHPETGLKFTVEVGPENNTNRAFIQEIKRIMDHLDEE